LPYKHTAPGSSFTGGFIAGACDLGRSYSCYGKNKRF
jgi:hypothetical protein